MQNLFFAGSRGDYGGAAISLPSSSDLDFFSSSPPPRQPPPPAAKSTTNVEGGGRLTGEEEEGEGELRARGTLFLPYSLSLFLFPLLFFHFHGIGRGEEGRRAKGSDRRGGGRPPKCQEFRCRRGKEKLLLLLLSLHQVSSMSPWDYGERLLSLCLSPGREGGGSLGLCSRRESIGHWEKKRGKEEEAEAEPPLSRRGEEKGGGRGERERALCMPPSPFLSLSLYHALPSSLPKQARVRGSGRRGKGLGRVHKRREGGSPLSQWMGLVGRSRAPARSNPAPTPSSPPLSFQRRRRLEKRGGGRGAPQNATDGGKKRGGRGKRGGVGGGATSPPGRVRSVFREGFFLTAETESHSF